MYYNISKETIKKPKNNVYEFVNNTLYSPAFSDYIYGEVLLQPEIFNLGVVSSTQTKSFTIWNLTKKTVNLLSIVQTGAAGINIIGDIPKTIPSNSSQEYFLEVRNEGPVNIDTSFEFVFDNSSNNKTLNVFGSRIAFFNFEPDTTRPLTENYFYTTEISTSYNGTEQRASLTIDPRFSLEAFYTFTGEDLQKLENILYSSGDRGMNVPIYTQSTRLTKDLNIGDDSVFFDTSNMSIQSSDKIMIKQGADYEIFEVDVVNPNNVLLGSLVLNKYNTNAIVMPVRLFYLNNNFTVNYLTDNSVQAMARFDKVDDGFYTMNLSNNSDYETHNDLPILLRKPRRQISFNKEYIRLFEDIDFTVGRRTRFFKDKTPGIRAGFDISLQSKEEIQKFKAFFHEMRGRYNEFYIDSGFQDFILTRRVSKFSNTLYVKNSNQSSYINDRTRGALRIKSFYGNEVYISNIVNYNDIGNGELQIVLEDQVQFDIELNRPVSVQYLQNCRFNNDSLKINYISDTYAEASIDVMILRDTGE